MYMDPARTDIVIAEHQRRMDYADRFGPLYFCEGAATVPLRTSSALTTAFANLFRAIGAALRSFANLAYDSRDDLRSNEHDLAAQGIRWPADAAYDAEVAAEAQAARQRRLAAGTITPLTPTRQARGHDTAASTPRTSSGEALVLVGKRLRFSPRAAAVGGSGQTGDESMLWK